MTSALTAAVPGLALGLSLMVAVGAQNAFVLRQGLLGERIGVVVLTCSLSDAALISASVAGTGAVVEAAPWLLVVVRLAGAAFLAGCAVLAARRACRPAALVVQTAGRTPVGALLVTCVALTWLNPHAYLDMLVLGTVAAAHEGHRWAFAAGAALASPLWFSAVGFGARLLRPVFGRPAAWRFLDAGTATVLGALAVSLLLP
jgi:L-lysine exporter family protein LysE/ArgO